MTGHIRQLPHLLQSLVLHSSASSPYKGTGALEHFSLHQFCSSPHDGLEQAE
jgi:hypothetical protein